MRSLKQLVVWLMVGVVGLVLIGTAAAASGNTPQPLIELYSRITGQTVVEAIDEPISVRQGNTVLTLDRGIASASQTFVEFVLESPELPDNLENMYDYTVAPSLLPPGNIRLEGFEENTIFSRGETRQPGAFHILLELPAPATFDAPVVIEFTELELAPFPANPDVEAQSLGGPWRFKFTPGVPEAQREQSVVELDFEGGNEDVAIIVDQLQRSATETVITYRLVPPTHENVGRPFGAETLVLGNERFEARGKDGTITPAEIAARSHTLSFPPLPADVDQFALEFGPFMVPRESPVEITLDVEKLRAGGQDVTVEGYDLHFWLEPWVGDIATDELHYRTADGKGIPFTFYGPTGELRVEDDLGRSYDVIRGGGEYDPERESYLKLERFRFSEPVQDGASKLTFRASDTGKIVDPFQIPITLP